MFGFGFGLAFMQISCFPALDIWACGSRILTADKQPKKKYNVNESGYLESNTRQKNLSTICFSGENIGLPWVGIFVQYRTTQTAKTTGVRRRLIVWVTQTNFTQSIC